MIHAGVFLFILGLVHSSPINTGNSDDSQKLETVQLTHYNGSLNEKDIGVPLNKIGTLEITFSEIKDVTKKTLQSLEKLENLTISYTHMERENKNFFKNCCPKLKNLEINHWIDFDANDLEGIGTLPLERLEILDQKIPVLKSGIFKGTNLKSLGLTSNKLEKIEDDAFDGLDQLENLLISNNGLNSIPKNVLVPLKSLETLELVSNGIERISADDFPELPNLTDIVIMKEDLKEIDLEGVHKVAPKLRDVYLIGSKDVHILKTDSQITIHNWI